MKGFQMGRPTMYLRPALLSLLISINAIGAAELPAELQKLWPEELAATLGHDSRAISADSRVFAARWLSKTESKGELKQLLEDPDAVVRRTAAETLFGADALGEQMAVKYSYSHILAAEQKA